MSADRFDDDDEQSDDYFSEVDDGSDTGLAPKFVKVADLDLQPTQLHELRVDDLFKKYIGIRDQLATDRKGYKAREARIKAQLLTIGGILLQRSQELGVESLSAATGTGYQQKKERLKVAPDGWDALTAWLLETHNFQVIQRRVSPDAVREIRDETGSLPPGVESTEELTFVVRSPTVRKR
jgi:hypothetical protein